MSDYTAASSAQSNKRLEADYRAGRVQPEPWRITMALDQHGLDGPEVDEACGAKEPAVDLWEAGQARPSWEQLELLAALTGMAVRFFFVKHGAEEDAPAFMCGPKGCKVIEPLERPAPYRADLAPVLPLAAFRRRASAVPS